MNPPGKTSLNRMQLAAQLEAERIEIVEDAHVASGALKEPRAARVALRDDFAGIVRLIDTIMSDAQLLARFEARKAQMAAAEAEAMAEAVAEVTVPEAAAE